GAHAPAAVLPGEHRGPLAPAVRPSGPPVGAARGVIPGVVAESVALRLVVRRAGPGGQFQAGAAGAGAGLGHRLTAGRPRGHALPAAGAVGAGHTGGAAVGHGDRGLPAVLPAGRGPLPGFPHVPPRTRTRNRVDLGLAVAGVRGPRPTRWGRSLL